MCKKEFTPGGGDDVSPGGVWRFSISRDWSVADYGLLDLDADSPDNSDDTWTQLQEYVDQLQPQGNAAPSQFSSFDLVMCGRKRCREKPFALLKSARRRIWPSKSGQVYSTNVSHEQRRKLAREKREVQFNFRVREKGILHETSVIVTRINTSRMPGESARGKNLSELEFDRVCDLLKKATELCWDCDKGSLKVWMEQYGLNESLIKWRRDVKADFCNDSENATRYQLVGSPEKWDVGSLFFRKVITDVTSESQIAPPPPKGDRPLKNMGLSLDLLTTAPGITEEERKALESLKKPFDPNFAGGGLPPLPGEDKFL